MEENESRQSKVEAARAEWEQAEIEESNALEEAVKVGCLYKEKQGIWLKKEVATIKVKKILEQLERELLAHNDIDNITITKREWEWLHAPNKKFEG